MFGFGKSEHFFINDPKASFWSGAATGIGFIAVIGFIILLVHVLSGRDTSTRSNTNSAANGAAVAVNPSAPAPSGPVDITVTKDDHIRGNPKAKVTIVEFSDFQCPFCQRFHPTLQRALKEYGNDIRWVYKHFPLDSLHPQARSAANAAECAGEQGKFWEFADALFENQSQLGDTYYKQLAATLGLNTKTFTTCVDSNTYADKVNSNYQEGLAAGVRGTPASFVNGELISGAQPYDVLKSAIDSLL